MPEFKFPPTKFAVSFRVVAAPGNESRSLLLLPAVSSFSDFFAAHLEVFHQICDMVGANSGDPALATERIECKGVGYFPGHLAKSLAGS